MAGFSIPIDFWVDPIRIKNSDERCKLVESLNTLLQEFAGSLTKITDVGLPGDNFLTIFGSQNMTATIKQYKEGLISTVLDYILVDESVSPLKFSIEDIPCLEDKLLHTFGCQRVKVLPVLKRAPEINTYFTSSDDRILEYDIDKVLFEEKTDFQKVQIVHSKSFGNMLVLDDLVNLAESDLSYTHGLMNKGVDSYQGKEVLILGGGDGALLHELLKEEPKFVTMIDIDEAVIVACRKFLRGACQDTLDKYEGDRYKIIIGDAIQYMKEYLKTGRKFDYVFGDLTDVPISKTPRGEHWDFMRSILDLGTKLLKPGSGRYMTHAIGAQCTSALRMFEMQIELLETPCTFTKSSSYVPSFMENWCYYQLTRTGT